MCSKPTVRIFLILQYFCGMKKFAFASLLVLGMVPAVYGQGCSVCTKTAAGLEKKSARGLNGGIIYLALLPLGIMGTMGIIWWRSNKNG
jgi:hypothetical protein